MIIADFDTAIPWLTPFDPSQPLHAELAARLRQLYQLTDETRLDETVTVVFDCLSPYGLQPVPDLQSEVWILVARAYHRFRRMIDATKLLDGVVANYRRAGDSHRQAVAQWLRGMVTLDNPYGCRQDGLHDCQQARSIFQSLSFQYERLNPSAYRAEWYADRVVEMDVVLARILENGRTWLTRFDSTTLITPLVALREQIDRLTRDRNIQAARQSMERMLYLARMGDGGRQYPYALVECAIAEVHLGLPAMAAPYLTEAMYHFPPHSHTRAVAQWMLGCLQWDLPDCQAHALANWEEAAGVFQELGQAADRRGDMGAHGWYRAAIQAMQSNLERNLIFEPHTPAD